MFIRQRSHRHSQEVGPLVKIVNLSADQQAVITNYTGARSVIAGPGSGKSTMLVELIRTLLSAGVQPSEIKAVTFSKEMASTLAKKVGVPGIVSTFHSLGYAICSETEHKPVEPELRFRLMKKLVRKWGLDYKEFDSFIAQMRRDGVTPDNALLHEDYGKARAYSEYECTRRQEGWIDFDCQISDAVDLLEKNATTRRRHQVRYLLVDESQDTDDRQFRLSQLLTERHGNITCVGDVSQALYSFRGAKPENITNFEKWFPGHKEFFLGLNYRSTATLVKFIRENAPPETSRELLERMNAARDVKGDPISFKMYLTEDEEAESALTLAQQDPLHSIILARTNRIVGVLERLCNRHQLRYHLLGKTGLWKQNEIRKAIDALKAYPLISTEAGLNLVLPGIEKHYAVEDRTERDNDALANLNLLRRVGQDFRMAKDFVVYANKMIHRRNDPKGVSISTVHQAKGLEYRNVYIVGANAKNFPHPKGDLKEEHRIWFVAISRAADTLRISFSGTPSPYLRRYISDDMLVQMYSQPEKIERLQEQHNLFT